MKLFTVLALMLSMQAFASDGKVGEKSPTAVDCEEILAQRNAKPVVPASTGTQPSGDTGTKKQ